MPVGSRPDKRLFYTKESFDDFYPGKGSTYPDLQGGVGVLFEQASARGHVQESKNGPLTFSYGITNQFRSALSMVEGLAAARAEFLRYKAEFFETAMGAGWTRFESRVRLPNTR